MKHKYSSIPEHGLSATWPLVRGTGRVLRTTLSLVGLLVALAIECRPVLAQQPLASIIDVHAHFLPGPGLTFEQAAKSAIEQMDKFGIARTIVMSPPRSKAIALNYEYSDFLAAVDKYPERFKFLAGGGSLNLMLHQYNDPRSVTDKVRQQFAAMAKIALKGGAKGFGEMSSLHISLSRAHVYSFVPADHPLLLVLSDVAAEHDIPLDLHMDALFSGRKTPPDLKKFPNNPSEFPATIPSLKRLLAYNSKAKVIWAHGGTDHLGDLSAKTIRNLMDKYPNLYVSLKVVGPKAPTRNKLYNAKAVHRDWLSLLRRHSGRFVIGTDNFYVGPDTAADVSISGFSKTNAPKLSSTVRFLSLLPRDLARKIASENAIRIFRMTPIQPLPVSTKAQSSATSSRASQGGLCKDGNMEHCRFACGRGVRAACNRLKRGR